MSEIDVAEAQGMTRAQAIEAMRFSPSARDRRMAELLAAGPEITLTDESRLRTLRLKRAPVWVGVAQLRYEIAAERIAARGEMAELAGGRL